MKNVRKVFFGLLLLLPFCISTIFADECTGTHCMNKDAKGQSCKMCQKREKISDEMMSNLGVTSKQHAQFQEFRRNLDKKIEIFTKQIKEKKDAIKTELMKKNYDMTVLERLTNDIKEIGGSLAAEKASIPIKIRKILTTEQFVGLEAKKAELKRKMPPPIPMEE